MNNKPEIKIGIVAVSRDCFPESLSVNRRKALVDAYTKKYGAAEIYECPICIVESEIHMVQALEDVKKAGCNALVGLSWKLRTGNFRNSSCKTFRGTEDVHRRSRGIRKRPGTGQRRRILRYAECKLQPAAA